MNESNGKQSKRNGKGGGTTVDTRQAYARYAPSYTKYANGDPARELHDFEGRRFAYGDSVVWGLLQRELDRIVKRTPMSRSINVLDAGCGDGVWAIRVANYLEGV